LAIVNLVNAKFTNIKFEASPNAREGQIAQINQEEFLEQVQVGDGIIYRTNAPLVEPCFSLIRRGIKATILGRDIGKGLISLVNKRAQLLAVHNSDNPLGELISQLYIYFDNEREKLEKANKQARIAALLDQIETIVAISGDCNTIEELKQKIKNTFSDDSQGIVFSSIHKAKGLEWDTVYILRPDLLPHPMAKEKSDQQKDKLYFVK